MKLHELDTKTLFFSHLLRLITEHCYIRLNVDDSGTTISFGSENYDKETFETSNAGSFVEFKASQKCDEVFDLQELKDSILLKHPQILVSVTGNEMTIENKIPVPLPAGNPSGFHPDSLEAELMGCLWDYLDTHKRTVLRVSKNRYLEWDCNIFSATPISRYDLANAGIIFQMSKNYSNSCCGAVDGDYFTTRQAVECLDRDKFDIFVLHEDEETVTYEIVNTTI